MDKNKHQGIEYGDEIKFNECKKRSHFIIVINMIIYKR